MTTETGNFPATKLSQIAILNDQFRRTLTGGRIHLTPGVTELSGEEQASLLVAVASFSAFTPDNNPYEERDFGSIDIDGERFFWKIDYYNADCTAGSDDPSDPSVTTRVLTIMRSDEY